ncbi:MAG TPA: tetratricopeptide repeat protein [Candidatus Limnocylindria bacterium]|nr:tetratricopeptide repeat protein [Candidatus Limnocylindria bacterium]
MTEPEALAVLQKGDPVDAGRAATVLWQLWHRSGDTAVDAQLRQGIEAMERQELREADEIFGRIIRAAPGFAEGWNKRATARYLVQDYEGSIADCRETLARNPAHFGALSGQGLCHLALGQYREAAALFRRALAVHPHLTAARANLRTAVNELVKWN